MPDDYEPPENKGGRREVLGPAVMLARANPMRWVLVTTHKNKNSAASYVSKLRNENGPVARSGIEARHDGCDIYVRYNEDKDEFLRLQRPADAPDGDDPAFAVPPPLDPPADLS